MEIGKLIYDKRKEAGMTQEQLAGILNVARQTVSKWETGETVPDIRQSKKMAALYNISLDELIDFDLDIREIQETIERTSRETEAKIDWSRAWGKKYPVLLEYQDKVNIPNYEYRLSKMMDEIRQEYMFNEQDAMLVLKDILYRVWKKRSEKTGK